MYLERFEETAMHSARGIAVARAAGQDDVFPTLYPCHGSAAWLLGRLDESAEVLDAAVEAARLAGNTQAIAWGLLNRALGAIMTGDLEFAMRAAHESVDLAGPDGETFVSSLALIILAWVLHECGESARAAEVMVFAGGDPELRRIPGGWRATYLEVLTRSWLAIGRVDEAKAAAAAALAVSDQVGLPRTASMANRAVADVALFLGEADPAVEHARIAVAMADKASARVDAAFARIVLGQALAQAEEVADAAAALERAAADFEGFGAFRWRDQAEHELRKLGFRVHRRTQPGAGGEGMGALSGRELEVARLVVDRRTNPEIAADLFLSLKTVETHMRNIFRKLGVSSRVEVARVAERAGLA